MQLQNTQPAEVVDHDGHLARTESGRVVVFW
jgi:hypothetical protein